MVLAMVGVAVVGSHRGFAANRRQRDLNRQQQAASGDGAVRVLPEVPDLPSSLGALIACASMSDLGGGTPVLGSR